VFYCCGLLAVFNKLMMMMMIFAWIVSFELLGFLILFFLIFSFLGRALD